MDRTKLTLPYKTCIQSILSICIQCWGGGSLYKTRLGRVVELGGKITGEPMCKINYTTDQSTMKLAHKMVAEYVDLQGEGVAFCGL